MKVYHITLHFADGSSYSCTKKPSPHSTNAVQEAIGQYHAMMNEACIKDEHHPVLSSISVVEEGENDWMLNPCDTCAEDDGDDNCCTCEIAEHVRDPNRA